MCTGGEYRGVPHDRHFSAASSFQIGVLRGRRMCSSGMLALVSQRLHLTSSQPYLPFRHCAIVGDGWAGPPYPSIRIEQASAAAACASRTACTAFSRAPSARN
jgi:hypothetical protein